MPFVAGYSLYGPLRGSSEDGSFSFPVLHIGRGIYTDAHTRTKQIVRISLPDHYRIMNPDILREGSEASEREYRQKEGGYLHS